jgi:hypothetical protein
MTDVAPVIFLDIDGPLVTPTSLRDGGLYCADRACMARLNELVAAAGADIVISSSWRIDHSLEFIRGAFSAAGFRHRARIIDVTPSFRYRSASGLAVGFAIRADHIRQWLAENDPKRNQFIVIDDESDADIPGHFVHVKDPDAGFSDADLVYATSLLLAQKKGASTDGYRITEV